MFDALELVRALPDDIAHQREIIMSSAETGCRWGVVSQPA
jgi:hypothetical protein